MEIDLFIGRFHPLVVHLPIGFLLLAIIMELISIKYPEKFLLSQAVKLTLIAGILGSIVTIVTGLLLSNEGNYDIDTLNTHKWMGISILILSIILLSIKHFASDYSSKISMILSVLFFILISATGHLGGVLTHGEDYLFQYAPTFVRQIAGMEKNEKQDFSSIHPDSINIYTHILQPVLEAKCVECHNPSKKEGDLILTSFSNLMIGGEDGKIINTQDPYSSSLLTRVTLPLGHKKFMPPKGSPLSFGEIKILECWMSSGADSTTKFSDLKLNNELISIIERDYDLDYNEKPFIEKMLVEPVSSQTIEKLEQGEYLVMNLGVSTNMLSLKFQSNKLTTENLKLLELVKDQVTWLDLSNCDFSDDMLTSISKLINVTRLDLHSNPISDAEIAEIAELKHLESLNLYNTNISDSGLMTIVKMEGLKRLYVWQTKVSDQGLDQAQLKNPTLEIDNGFNLN